MKLSVTVLSSSEEPSAARIAELKHFVTEHGISNIYFEENAKIVLQNVSKRSRCIFRSIESFGRIDE